MTVVFPVHREQERQALVFPPPGSGKFLQLVICGTKGRGSTRACLSQKDWSEEKGGCRQWVDSQEMGRGGEMVQTHNWVVRERTAWVLPLSSKDWGHDTKNPNMSVLWLSESKDWQSGFPCGKHPNKNCISKKRNRDFIYHCLIVYSQLVVFL